MSSPLKQSFEEQALLQQTREEESDDAALAEIVPSLTFSLREELFVCRLDEVKEVVEITPLTPYPVQTTGHLGLVNLRGKVIPVLCPLFAKETRLKAFDAEEFSKMNNEKYRLIVFQEENNEDFAIIAKDVHKKTSLLKQWQDQDVIKMDKHPYKVFYREDVKKAYRELK